jgi:hypothetical protein
MTGCLKMLASALAAIFALHLIGDHYGASAARWFAGGMMCTGGIFIIELVLNELRERDAA